MLESLVLAENCLLSELSTGKVRCLYFDKNRKSIVTANGPEVVRMTLSKDGVWVAYLRRSNFVVIMKLVNGSGIEVNLKSDEILSGETLNTLFIHSNSKGEYVLYVGGSNGVILTWKIRDENNVIGPQKIVIPNVGSVDSLVVYHSEVYLAVDSGTKVVKLDKNCQVLNTELFTCSSPPITSLSVLKHVRGLAVVSQSLYIAVYSLKNLSKLCYLTCEFLPKRIDVLQELVNDSYQMVLAIGEMNEVCVWVIHKKFESTKPFRPVARVVLDSKSTASHRILSARFCRSNPPGSILIAHGVLVRPMFSNLNIFDSNGNFIEKQCLLSVGEALVSDRDSIVAGKNSVSGPHVVDRFDLPLDGVISSTVDFDAPVDSEGVAFEKLVSHHSTANVDDSFHPFRVSSAAAVLSGAITSNDLTQINAVLENTEEDFIRSTLQTLPISQVLPFLSTLLSQFQSKPFTKSVIWARQLLIIHHSYLSSNPDILKQLSGWYHLTESRVEDLSQLIKLSGRFDLLIPKIRVEKNGEQKSLQAYIESDDTDDMPAILPCH